jgi:hypothetical protein
MTAATRPLPLRRSLLLATGVLAVAGALALASSGGAQADDPPPPIMAEPLTGPSTFTDDVAIQVREKPDGRSTEVINLRDASQIITAEVTVQPGAVFPWHTHPGTALAVVADGAEEGTAFEFMYDDCSTYAYEVGQAFVDPGFDNVHTARNPSEEVTTVIVTFIGVKDASAGLTIPIDPGEAAALNVACDTNAPVPQD